MASKLQLNGSSILEDDSMVWLDGATPSGNLSVITLASLASGSGRIGTEIDRGAGPYEPGLYVAKGYLMWGSALTAGNHLGDLFVLERPNDSVTYEGNLGGTDAAVASAKFNNLGPQLVFSGVADSTSSGELQVITSRPFMLSMPLVNVAWINRAGVSMHATTPGYFTIYAYSQFRTATA